MNEEDDLQGDRATPQASDRERRLADALTAAVLRRLGLKDYDEAPRRRSAARSASVRPPEKAGLPSAP